MPRPSHQRGTKAAKRGISKEKVCITCAVDLNGLSVAKVSNLGKPSLVDLQKVLDDKIAQDSVLVTDSLNSYQKLSQGMDLNHIPIPRGKHKSGIFNIQTVNSHHSNLKSMLIHRFRGVATKYLNHYLVYHNFVNFAKGTPAEKKTILLDFIRNTRHSLKSVELRISKFPAIPI